MVSKTYDMMPPCEFATACLHHYDGSKTVGVPYSAPPSIQNALTNDIVSDLTKKFDGPVI